MKLLKEIFLHYFKSNTFEKGAALSYYAAFSFLPIIVIIVSILGMVFTEDTISEELSHQLQQLIGDQGASQIEELIKNQHSNYDNIFNTIIGFITLALAATGMFNQIQKSLNAIWGLKVKIKYGIVSYFIRHLTSFIILILIGVILLLSTAINSFIYKFATNLPEGFTNAPIYEHIFSFFIITIMIAMFFRFLGNAIVPWRTALLSATFTSVLFILGKIAIGMYIAKININSTFGAASVIAFLMIWVYYTSQILFIGASFAYVVGQKLGYEIKPAKNAVRYIQQEVS